MYFLRNTFSLHVKSSQVALLLRIISFKSPLRKWHDKFINEQQRPHSFEMAEFLKFVLAVSATFSGKILGVKNCLDSSGSFADVKLLYSTRNSLFVLPVKQNLKAF